MARRQQATRRCAAALFDKRVERVWLVPDGGVDLQHLFAGHRVYTLVGHGGAHHTQVVGIDTDGALAGINT